MTDDTSPSASASASASASRAAALPALPLRSRAPSTSSALSLAAAMGHVRTPSHLQHSSQRSGETRPREPADVGRGGGGGGGGGLHELGPARLPPELMSLCVRYAVLVRGWSAGRRPSGTFNSLDMDPSNSMCLMRVRSPPSFAARMMVSPLKRRIKAPQQRMC